MSDNTPTNLQDSENTGEDFASLLETYNSPKVRLQPGQKVSGTIIAMTGENIFLDIGIKVDGIMDRKDILDANGETTLNVGDSIESWVTSVSAQEIRLSRSGSGVSALEDAKDAGIPVDGKVLGTCNGGYNVEVMQKRAFCPGSQMGRSSFDDPNSVVGKTLPFIITRIESNGRNIVVSHRAFLERERQESLAKLLETIKEGDTVEGRITRLAPFGAFMEIAPSVEGMIHISELTWSRVSSSDEAVSEGDLVRAKVLSITQDAKGGMRISLSRKQAEGDPWADVESRLSVDTVVTGRVVRLTSFGVFVEVLPGVDGLVHISEMSWTKRVHKPEDFVAVGDTVTVKIKELSLEARRLSLSMRDAESDPWSTVAEQFPVGTLVSGTVESRAQFGFFVNLAPGITGLLPNAAIKDAKNAKELSTLEKGQTVSLKILSLDVEKRRISLGSEESEEREDTSWKEHTKTKPARENKGGSSASTSTDSGSFGNLSQAFAAALDKKNKK